MPEASTSRYKTFGPVPASVLRAASGYSLFMRETRLFESGDEHQRCLQLLEAAGLGSEERLHIGIKKVSGDAENT